MALGKMFWRGSLKAFYCKVDGKFTRLGIEEGYAEKEYRKLQIEHGSLKNPKVGELVDIYLNHCKTNTSRPIKASTLKNKRTILDTFVAMYGKLSHSTIKERHVTTGCVRPTPTRTQQPGRTALSKSKRSGRTASSAGSSA